VVKIPPIANLQNDMHHPMTSLLKTNELTKYKTEYQSFVKLKEVQANAQSQSFCTTFNFTPTHQSTTTTPNDKL
jgi:hypothetical protein